MSGNEAPGQNGLRLASIDGGQDQRLSSADSAVALAGDHLLFIRDNTLMAERFDAARGQVVGDAVPIVEGVSLPPEIDNLYAPISASNTGMLVYQSARVTNEALHMTWYDRIGQPIGTAVPPGPIFEPALSPDGRSLVFERNRLPGADLWLRDLTRGTEQRLTTDDSANLSPVWSPSGDRIAFCSNRNKTVDLFELLVGGLAPPDVIFSNGDEKHPSQWSRNGIVHTDFNPQSGADIWVMPVDSGRPRTPIPFLRSPANEFLGQLSPDGRWMAYVSDESGRDEVYVRSFPAGEGQRQMSVAGGTDPRWRDDGREIYFAGADDRIMAVPVSPHLGTRPDVEPGPPRALFDAPGAYEPDSSGTYLEVAPHGDRFILDSPVNPRFQRRCSPSSRIGTWTQGADLIAETTKVAVVVVCVQPTCGLPRQPTAVIFRVALVATSQSETAGARSPGPPVALGGTLSRWGNAAANPGIR